VCKIARVVNFSGSHVQQNTTTCRLYYDHISNLIYPKCINQDVPCKWKAVHVCLRLVVFNVSELLLNATNSIPVPSSDSML
jgi:hypothetical protein